mmetsp:Transcript_8239/g.17664  ORF Transcript_8239/g.17664 Transcript_8239/m.17664 type:complete len:374 (-) Transcript_8239:170-1291(-)
MGSNIYNSITSSPASLALITFTTCIAVSLALSKTNDNKIMATKETARALAGPPNLPESYTTSSFTNSRNQSIFTAHLPRKDTSTAAKAVLLLAHGIAEHCLRPGYLRLYQASSEEGVDVYAMDHHGHGRSDGEPRGYAEKFDHFIDDFVEFAELKMKDYMKKEGEEGTGECPPVILMGQSMGGLIAAMAATSIQSKVSGIILTGPAMGVDMTLEMKIQKVFSPMIDKIAPKARIVDAVDPKDLSRNESAVQDYINDPLCSTGKLVARTCIQFDKTFDVMKAKRSEIQVPLLILHGTADKTTSGNASLEFFKHVSTPLEKKRYLRLPGLYHEVFEEPETEQILGWLAVFAKSGGTEFGELEGEETEGVFDVKFK